MKDLTSSTADLARTVLESVPTIVLFMGGVVSVLAYSGLQLLEMLKNAA